MIELFEDDSLSLKVNFMALICPSGDASYGAALLARKRFQN